MLCNYVAICCLLVRVTSIPLAMLPRARSVSVNDVGREAVKWQTKCRGKELRKMVHTSVLVMMGSHNCLRCWRVVRVSWNCCRYLWGGISCGAIPAKVMGKAVTSLDLVGNDSWLDCCIVSQTMGEGEELLNKIMERHSGVVGLARRKACQRLWLQTVNCDHRSVKTSSGNGWS